LIKPLLKYYLFIFIFSLSISNSFAQADMGELFDITTLESNDTIQTRRTYGTWWFGLTAGGNFQKYYGNIFMPEDPNRLTDTLRNPEHALLGGIGGGFQDYGFFAEYQPAGGNWGVSLRSYYSNKRTISASSEKIEVENAGGFTKTILIQTTDPQNKSFVDYYTFSPSFRLNLYKGFYFLFGADIDILKSSFIQHVAFTNNPDPIIETRIFDLKPVATRYGAHFGMGYDLFVLDYNKGNRVLLSPFFTVGTGTAMFNKNADGISNPNLSSFSLKFGLSVKFSSDKEKNDTLFYNPNAKEVLSTLASAQIDRGVDYQGFTRQELTEAPNISYVAIPEIVEQVKEEPVFANEQAKEDKVVKTEEKIKVLTSEEVVKLKTILYFSDTQIQLNQNMKDYLASVAVYLKEHPKATVVIDTHTDNRGLPAENKKKSDDRASAALKYLLSKTISKARIFAKGLGDIKPVGDNNTDEGRRKNRRIEITVRP
jgi:outer membrane protein OmpA-like peptidoglycan-associated protein